MNPFAVVNVASFEEASERMRSGDYALPVLKAGGQDVIDHLKEGLIEPDALIDIRRVRSADTKPVSLANGRIRIDALATLTEIERSEVIRKQAPAIGDAVRLAATPQVRNVASAAGNLLQRPRCWYYRRDQFDCLKKGGDRCYAVEGENKYHAILGGASCHIVHRRILPSR